MNTYENKNIKHSETTACNILNSLGIKCSLNNTVNKNDVDIITDNNKKIDVQYSENFSKYYDYRLDIVSAFKPKDINKYAEYIYNDELSFFENFENKYKCTVIKKGKLFQKDYVDYLIILFYNKFYNSNTPDNILIFNKDNLLNYMQENKEQLFNQLKINDKDKHNLKDMHGSAFIPLKAGFVKTITNGFLGSYNELIKQSKDIIEYFK